MVTLAAASWGTWSLFLRPTGLPSTITAPIMFVVMAVVTWPMTLRDREPVWDRKTLVLLVGRQLTTDARGNGGAGAAKPARGARAGRRR